ncbi:adenylyl cyclase [Dactylosporangium sp. NPDC049525]|uniref:adenylyl cyclase n=1 Tax=Dactylosporangium sp. NPDC049525 TaxID=3154730 RepID=UPI00344992B1
MLGAAGSALLALPAAAAPGDPDFGPNVTILDPGMSADAINAILAAASGESEFSTARKAIFFKPGTYGSAAGAANPATATGIVLGKVGYYETVAGLGALPGDVLINGALHVEPVHGAETDPWNHQSPGSLTQFWRSMSNLAINPIQRPTDPNAPSIDPARADPHQLRWAVSQAAPMRRVDIQGNLTLMGRYGEYASGGFLADSRVSGTIVSGSQQQWYTRDSTIGTWNGGVWNMVFSGVQGAPAQDFPDSPSGDTAHSKFTTLNATPMSREAPFLTWNEANGYAVFVPNARPNASGAPWQSGTDSGTSLPIDGFYLAKPSDSAATINAQLQAGKNLILTPGVYSLDQAINVTRAGTVVLGLGMATLSPTAGNAAITVGDVTGVKLAGITVDAGAVKSAVLVRVGPANATHSDAADPTTLSDVFIRVGGPQAGSIDTAIEVNSDNVLLDDIWSWRADHGAGAAWGTNTAKHGLVVNGDNVTATGLFVEHYQQQQVIWNGNGGTTVFYQSETPYDPPSQDAWMDGTKKGYASYKVGANVTSHQAYGLGIYSFFNQGVDVRLDSAIEAPKWSTVQFHDSVARFLNGSGGINNVVNDAGGPVAQGNDAAATKYLRSYPPAGTADPPPSTGGDDQQTITATIPEAPGEFSWTIDATDHSVTLSNAANMGTFLQSTGQLKPVKVTDTRAGGPAWSLSGQVGDFTGGLSGKYLGWTPSVIVAGAGAVAGGAVASGFDSGNGLTDASVLGSAIDGHGKGTATLGGGLDLRVPAETAAGTYTTTLTLTALS